MDEGIIYRTTSCRRFFGSDNYLKYDGILSNVSRPGLIPFKAMAMDSGVNFTAGLNVVRTSPDHGTAYDIAGQNLASKFIPSLYMAVDIIANRRKCRIKSITNN